MIFKDPRTPTAAETSLKKWICVPSIFIEIIPTYVLCQIGELACIWRSKWALTIAMKIERTGIHILSEVFFAVAVGLSFLLPTVHLIRRIPFNYLLVNLAAADISYATFAVPNIILSHHVYHPEGLAGTLLCTTLTGGNLSWIGGRASMITLLVIAIERYFAVVHPHGNKRKLTNRKLKVCDIQV